MTLLQFVIAGLVAYLIGSFPSGVVVSRLKPGAPDVRYHGSGHIGGTNTMRLLGPRLGALVVVVDSLKGLVAWAAAYLITLGSPWALPLAAVMAVAGHCWPLYTRFHGGMGLATGGGLMFVLMPLAIVLTMVIWAIIFMGIFKKQYSPRALTLALPLAVALTLAIMPMDLDLQWTLILITVVLIVRHLPEWNRVE